MLNFNYMEIMHGIAEVPMPPKNEFYPTEDEQKWAEKERKAMEEGPIIVWTLSGSAVHKTWVYLDNAIAKILLTYPTAKIVTVGDNLCQILETGWEEEPRVIMRSGLWSIRQTLTFVKHQADLVVGPETGVLNSISQLPIEKVIFLSHSTEENLTKHWENTQALIGDVHCYPCHQLHYGSDYCPLDPVNGGALCQNAITPEMCFDAIMKALNQMEYFKWQPQAV
jgi:ADP-heptose:LPS heptosyltransferase